MATVASAASSLDKENQTSAQGNVAARSKEKPKARLSPWEQYNKDIMAACDKMGPDAVLMQVSNQDNLLESSGVLQRELGEGARTSSSRKPIYRR
jgi:hypothetical protein